MAITVAERAHYEGLDTIAKDWRAKMAALVAALPKVNDPNADHSDKAHRARWARINAVADQCWEAEKARDKYAQDIKVREGML